MYFILWKELNVQIYAEGVFYSPFCEIQIAHGILLFGQYVYATRSLYVLCLSIHVPWNDNTLTLHYPIEFPNPFMKLSFTYTPQNASNYPRFNRIEITAVTLLMTESTRFVVCHYMNAVWAHIQLIVYIQDLIKHTFGAQRAFCIYVIYYVYCPVHISGS